MPFYEVIYENGRVSVMETDTEAEMLEGVAEQHRRALAGEVGGPHGGAAERIKRVLEYDCHPNDYNPTQKLSNNDIQSAVSATLKSKDDASLYDVIEGLRDEVHPMVSSAPHESNFKMKEVNEIVPVLWGGDE